MFLLPKKKIYKNLAIASFVWVAILLFLKIIGYSGLMSSESPLFVFIILVSIFFIGGLLLLFKSKKL